jgi:hypothetical protein
LSEHRHEAGLPSLAVADEEDAFGEVDVHYGAVTARVTAYGKAVVDRRQRPPPRAGRAACTVRAWQAA